MLEFQNKDEDKIKDGMLDLKTILADDIFGFKDVNNAISNLLSLKKNMVTEANSHAQMSLDNTKYTIDGLFHFRVLCVDNLEFSYLDNPGLVSLVGISFLPFNFDDYTKKDSPSSYTVDGTPKKSLDFAKKFATHDFLHSDIIELRIVRALDSNRKTNILKAINSFIESKRNYHIISRYIDNLEEGVEKRALELVKFNMGHEDLQAPNFWSNHSLEIFRHLCDRSNQKKYAPTTIEILTKRLRSNFAYPEQYKHSSENQIIPHTRAALYKIFEILDVSENYVSHANKIDRFF